VALSTVGTQLPLRERQLLAWIAPRGIVAAAVSSLFALRLEQVGHPEAGFLVPLTFMVLIGTVILQGCCRDHAGSDAQCHISISWHR
jgi:NhaP-type Na+/H+ or K+/H+ antiporter